MAQRLRTLPVLVEDLGLITVPWQVFQTLWALLLTDTYSHIGIIFKNWGLERDGSLVKSTCCLA